MHALGKSSSGRSLSCIFPCPCRPGFKNPLAHNIKDRKNLSLVAFPLLSWLPGYSAPQWEPSLEPLCRLPPLDLDLPGAGSASQSPSYVPGIPQAEKTLLISCVLYPKRLRS